MSEENNFSKKGQRKVSSFIGQELLYDFMTGQLDKEREKAVKEFTNTNREAQADIQKIQNGLNYAEKLQQTQVSEALLNKITVPSSYSQVLLEIVRFHEWTPALKLGIEATVVALGITVFAVLIPWHRLMDLRFGSRDVILTEVEKTSPVTAVAESSVSTKEDLTFPDEGATSPTTTTIKTAAKVAAQTPTTTSSTTTTTVAVAASSPSSGTPAAVEKANAVAAPSGEEKRQGELYRGVIQVTNVPAISPKLVERIQALGARKAGQVELGWIKGEGAPSYFHFTMPASQYEELKNIFAEYGQLKISKEKHERVMPEGIMRIIIDVEEKK